MPRYGAGVLCYGRGMAVLFRLSLILIFLASGIALGAARGQLRVAGAVVLCAGEAVQVQLVDVRGQPVKRTHICPDMALSLMAAVAPPAPDMAVRQGGARGLDPVPAAMPASGWQGMDARARGPPVPV